MGSGAFRVFQGLAKPFVLEPANWADFKQSEIKKRQNPDHAAMLLAAAANENKKL